jgi:adenine-specific DNA-methyltransferase
MPFLNWVNKDQAMQAINAVDYRLLNFNAGYGDANPNNMLIQGDNLEALRALMPYYAGQVKCIYIDPPYNTQSAFSHYDDKLEHSQWLSMITPRLMLLKDLLAQDGSIWVSIDDREAHYLKVLMDEIFGRENYLGDLIWKKRKGGGNDSHFFASDHEYILSYVKSSNKKYHPMKWRVSQTQEYLKRYKEVDENGERYYWDTLARNGLQNPIIVTLDCPDGSALTLNSQKSEKTIFDEFAKGHMRFSKGKSGWTVHHRVYMPKGQVLRSILEDVGTNKDSNDEIEFLFDDVLFDYPKPESLIKTILELTTNPNDLVLDSFLGSGTTAAVAHKMGRRYIGIEMGEHSQTHCIPRLQKVIDGEQGGISKAVNWTGGGGFCSYTLGETVFDQYGGLNEAVGFAALAAHIWQSETEAGAGKGFDTPFLGEHNGTGYYLLYNGILGDRKPNGGNVLTRPLLSWLLESYPHDGQKVIYGEVSRLDEERLAALGIVFKQIPYKIKGV